MVIRGIKDEDIETETAKFVGREVWTPEELVRDGKKRITLNLRTLDVRDEKLRELRNLLMRFRDSEGLEVLLRIKGEDFRAELQLPPEYRVSPSPELVEHIENRLRIKVRV